MSTNFYLRDNSGTELHVGKRSGGWAFMFRAQSQARSRADWERVVAESGEVFTEYGETLTVAEFWAEVDATRQSRNGTRSLTMAGMRGQQGVAVGGSTDYMDADGWGFTEAEFS